MKPILSKNETTSMRGIAIVFIILHNLLHQVLPTIENEFIFSIERSRFFASTASGSNFTLYQDIFSFLGWYGVTVFLFLSGYGLTLKYGFSTVQPFMARTFIWRHLKRVFLLMILPYALFAIMDIRNSQYLQVFLQFTLLSNIFKPDNIYPGVFWFFGLIAQLYILFAFIRNLKKRHYRSITLLSICAFSMIFMFCIPGDSETMNYIRHNFIGWLLPFSMGIWFAEQQSLNKFFDSYWKNAIWFVGGGSIVVISNFNYYTWCISPAFAIFASIGLTKVLTRHSCIDMGCVWLGALSSFLFAVHPIVRFLCTRYIGYEEMTRSLYLGGYLLASIALALAYRAIHKRFLSN